MGLDNVQLTLVETWDEAEALWRWLQLPRAILGVDTETGGLDWWRQPLRTVQFGDETAGWIVPFDQWRGFVQEAFRRYDGPIVMHNAKFDTHFLMANGVKLRRDRVHDSLIRATLVDNEGVHGLKSLAATLVDPQANALEKQLKDGMTKNGWGWDTIPTDFPPYWQYGALDPVLTVRVWNALEEAARPYERLYDMELAVEHVLTDMEQRGVKIDREYCTITRDALATYAADCAASIEARWGVTNPGSSYQIGKALQSDGVALTTLTDKGNIRLDETVLETIDHPLAKEVLEYRHATKISKTYLDNFLDLADTNDLLHPSVNALGARTGRMSVGRPSLQNLERTAQVRDAFVSREGRTLLLIDYDAIEYRLLAHYAQAETLLAAARDGSDMHTITAQQIYGTAEISRAQRQLTKNATYAKLYGAGAAKFALTAGISEEDARNFMAAYDMAQPEVHAFQEAVTRAGNTRLSTEGVPYITTHYGRRLRAPQNKGLYVLINYLIQGTAADVLKERTVQLALAGLDQYLGLLVHDEYVFDVPDDELDDFRHAAIDVLEEHDRFACPLTVDTQVTKRWGSKYRQELM